VSSGDYLAQVHYGSDVDVAADGACSGFPLDVKGETVGPNCIEIPRWISESKGKNHLTANGHSFTEKEIDYLRRHGWNLNSLPYVTLLRFANESIGGVSRPMMYIGSLFSSFCWHTEDNWLYSINYIHTGAPKRWYAISGPGAPKFERVLRAELPHLFDEEPQLLYQLTTTLDPAILRRHGVEICTTLQHEGEFIVTFPRAYHSGFNCGFNVAESVNFAAMRWLDWGIMAANEYRFVRSTVFPHEQFLWNLSMHAFEIKRLSVAKALRDQISLYCKFSEAAMQRLQARGITRHYQFTKKHLVIILDENSHPVGVEEVKDAPNRITADTHINLKDYDGFEPEDPQCFVCGYDLFFHRVDCACRSPRLPRCLKHAEHPICHCTNSQKFMSYRYRKSSFKAILRTLEMVISLLSGNSPSKMSVDET
jgi:histone demethylase JARID1